MIPALVAIAVGGTHAVRAYRAYRFALPIYEGYKQIADITPGLAGELGYGDQRIGVGMGSTSIPLGEVPILGEQLAGMPEQDVPVPWYEVALTSVHKDSPASLANLSKSPSARTQSSQPSATGGGTKKNSRSQTKKPVRKFQRRQQRPVTIPRKGNRCPHGYRYDSKKKMCVLKK